MESDASDYKKKIEQLNVDVQKGNNIIFFEQQLAT